MRKWDVVLGRNRSTDYDADRHLIGILLYHKLIYLRGPAVSDIVAALGGEAQMCLVITSWSLRHRTNRILPLLYIVGNNSCPCPHFVTLDIMLTFPTNYTSCIESVEVLGSMIRYSSEEDQVF
jgi:hypothetical protein